MKTNTIFDEIKSFTNFEGVLNSIDDDIAIIDRDFKVLFENSSCIKIHGNNLGKKCYQTYANMDSACPDCPSTIVFNNGKKATSEHTSYDSKGIAHHVEIVASPLKNTNGEVLASLEIVRDLTKRKEAEIEREKLINELQNAESEIKILKGIFPICSFCKKIRDDKGFWNQVEAYISKHSEAEFSHGLCPVCAKKHYPDYI